MLVNRPENMFFVLYSNLTIKTLRDFVDKNFNYKMHEFSDDEIDINDKNKLLENIETLKKEEIFDENLYEHGFFYNSSLNQNILHIFFHIGNVDYKDLQFDIIEYFEYLFKSKHLFKILKEKDYILINLNNLNNLIGIYTYLILENNNIAMLELVLTDKGLEEIENVLLIIYKYVDILKKEGYKKEYFDNFIKYKQNQIIINFDKTKMFMDLSETFTLMIQNYKLYGEKQILIAGIPTQKDYDENKLKKYLNNITYEKSFFAVNTKYNTTNIPTFLESISKEILNYYKADFLLGKIPNEFKNKMNNDNIITGLKMRDINPYFSEKNEKVIPCYKKKPNKCKELNEFDFEKEDEYKGTLLEEENKNYVTYYQIDKSSEAYIVNAYFEMNVDENELLIDNYLVNLEYYYLIHKLNEINELPTISLVTIYNTTLAFTFNCFSDNIEIIFKDFIEIIRKDPEEYEFNFIYNFLIFLGNSIDETPLRQYVFSIADTFINKENKYDYNRPSSQKFDNLTYNKFKEMNNKIFNSINSLNLKVTGNIDKDLVQRLHNIMKEKFKIEKISSQKTEALVSRGLSSNTPHVINYYEKSKIKNEIDNSILVIYEFDKIYEKYSTILQACLNNIGMTSLRLNYSDAYTPSISIYSNLIYIYEQGRYKEVTQMEDDINEVLLGMINGNIKCENYKDIIKSYKLKGKKKTEKTYNSLFNDYIYGKYDYPPYEDDIKYPDNFEDLIKEIAPIFTEPKRYTILISRSDMMDEDFNKLFENRTKNSKYIINPKINIEHTKDIDYLKK